MVRIRVIVSSRKVAKRKKIANSMNSHESEFGIINGIKNLVSSMNSRDSEFKKLKKNSQIV